MYHNTWLIDSYNFLVNVYSVRQYEQNRSPNPTQNAGHAMEICGIYTYRPHTIHDVSFTTVISSHGLINTTKFLNNYVFQKSPIKTRFHRKFLKLYPKNINHLRHKVRSLSFDWLVQKQSTKMIQ